MQRREIIKNLMSGSLLIFSGLLKPVVALAKWNQTAFTAEDYQTALDAYFPDEIIVETDQIKIGVHPVVENGAVVPVKIETDLSNPLSITIFVEKNPNPLIANFDLSPGCLGFVSTRIKMDQSSNLAAVVKTDSGVFSNKTFVEVHEGGCG